MDRSRAFSVGVVLRCLAPVEHAVVAHDADAAKPRAIWDIDGIFEGLCIRRRAPGHEKDEIARRQNRVEDVPADYPVCIGIESKVLGTVRSVRSFGPLSRPSMRTSVWRARCEC